mmetsp:Transcript_106311/g.266301  ORF Transcript_106311/g.266301 Transcript_106311/m.266301 type:complete len:304 (-) Transcript_106311:159-1070(-)
MAGAPDIGENQDWFYLDSTGQEFGPFPSETMRDWFTQGFFPIGEELLVRLPTWKNHVPLRMIYSEISDAFRSIPRANQGACGGGGGGGGGGVAQPPPAPIDTYGNMAPDRRMDETMSPLGAPSPHFAGYWMMPPGPAPYPAPGVGYGFPPAGVRPGGFMPPPPRSGGYGMHPVLPQGAATGRFEGRIKSFNAKQGFGFIECAEAHAIFGRDVFLHKAQIGDLKVGTQVTYSVEMNKQGMPQARELATLDGHAPGPSPANVSKGGGPGGRGKGGNKKGRGRGSGKGAPDDDPGGARSAAVAQPQ